MVTKVEINGYEISIEEVDGVISVTATKDEEVIEEFTIEVEEGEEGQDEEGQDVQSFDEFGQDEEEDFSEEGQDDDDDDEESQEEELEGKLESFQSFINRKK